MITSIYSDEDTPGGHLTENIMHFARVLRCAGIPVGPGRLIEAVRAVEQIGIQNRNDLYWALNTVFVSRNTQREIYDQAFDIFWRDPGLLEKMEELRLPSFGEDTVDSGPSRTIANRRLTDAFFPPAPNNEKSRDVEEVNQIADASLTYSDQEQLKNLDFDSMSAAEIEEARKTISKLNLVIRKVPTRRLKPHKQGQSVDLRSTMRSSLRLGSSSILLQRRIRTHRLPPLIVLCDISGSMSEYSRMFLHFMHSVTNSRDRVYTFVFGTRLSSITRYLGQKDIDVALEKVSASVKDWSGGTRIGACLREFNVRWSRRIQGHGALVMMISDGLDRGSLEELELEVQRLHNSCRRLIWLNPLLRYDRYEATASGAAALLKHVDELRTIHNLNSMIDLVSIFSDNASMYKTNYQAYKHNSR